MILCAALLVGACKGGAGHGPEHDAGLLRTDQDRTLYALGMLTGQRLSAYNLTPAEILIVQQGMLDHLRGAPKLTDLREWGPRVGELARARVESRMEEQKARGREYTTRAAAEPGARRLPSGAVYRELHAGTGPSPLPIDTVRVNYRARLLGGLLFDTTYSAADAGVPVEFAFQGMIPCWSEGIALMKVGGKARLVCPSDTAYGDHGQSGIPPGATVVYEIELVGITNLNDAAPGAHAQ